MLLHFTLKRISSATLRLGICACAASILGFAGPGAAAVIDNAKSGIAGGVPLPMCFSGGGPECVVFPADQVGPSQPNVFPLTQTFSIGSASVTNVGPSIDPSLQALLNVDNASVIAPAQGATVTANIGYHFVVNGPPGPVLVDFSGQMGGDWTGTTTKESNSSNIINIYSQANSIVYSLTDPITGLQQEPIDEQLSLTAGQEYLVF
jgi:hypothetical protein